MGAAQNIVAAGSAALFRVHPEIVEIRDRIPRGPKPYLAGAGEGAVLSAQNTAMVQVHLNAGTGHRDLENPPRIGWHVVLDRGPDRNALAVLHFEERHVLLHGVGQGEGVGAGDAEYAA